MRCVDGASGAAARARRSSKGDEADRALAPDAHAEGGGVDGLQRVCCRGEGIARLSQARREHRLHGILFPQRDAKPTLELPEMSGLLGEYLEPLVEEPFKLIELITRETRPRVVAGAAED